LSKINPLKLRIILLTALLIVLIFLIIIGRQGTFEGYKNVLIRDVPHIQQREDFCGEASVAMYLEKLGFKVSQDDIFNISGVDPRIGRGMYAPELVRTLKKIGFKTGRAGYWISVKNPEYGLKCQWSQLHRDLLRGIPSIVCMGYSSDNPGVEHFRLILGYDPGKDEVIYHDPAIRDGAYLRMSRKLFFSLWPLKYKPRQWLILRIRLQPDRITIKINEAARGNAKIVQQVMKIKNKQPSSKLAGWHMPDIWKEYKSGGLVFYYQPGSYAEQHIKEAAKDFNKAFMYAKGFVPLLKSPPRISVYLHDDLPLYGFADIEHKSVHCIYSKDFQLISHHEMLHILLKEVNPYAPERFEEGVCRFQEERSIQGEDGKLYLAPLYQLGKWYAKENWKTGEVFEDFYEGDIQGNFAASFVFFCFKSLGKEKFWQFYKDLNKTNYKVVLEKYFGMSQDGIDLDFSAFMQKIPDPPTVFLSSIYK